MWQSKAAIYQPATWTCAISAVAKLHVTSARRYCDQVSLLVGPFVRSFVRSLVVIAQKVSLYKSHFREICHRRSESPK